MAPERKSKISFSRRCENCRLYYPENGRSHSMPGGESCTRWIDMMQDDRRQKCPRYSALDEKTFLISPHYGIRVYCEDDTGKPVVDMVDIGKSSAVIARFRNRTVASCMDALFKHVASIRLFISNVVDEMRGLIPVKRGRRMRMDGISAIMNDNIVTDGSPARNRMDILFAMYPKNAQVHFILMEDGEQKNIPIRFSVRDCGCFMFNGKAWLSPAEYARSEEFGWPRIGIICSELEDYLSFSDALLALKKTIIL